MSRWRAVRRARVQLPDQGEQGGTTALLDHCLDDAVISGERAFAPQ